MSRPERRTRTPRRTSGAALAGAVAPTKPTRAPHAHDEPAEPDDERLVLERQLCFALYSASRLLTRAYRPLLEPLGLTYPQYLVMLVLWERDRLGERPCVNALGERLMLDSGTLTPLLKRLESEGLLERARARDDERRVEVGLTAQGRALRERARAVPKTLLERSSLPLEQLVELKLRTDALVQALRGELEELRP